MTEAEYGDCTLHTASKAVAPASLCQMGTFACGPSTMCKKNAEVCVHTTGGAQGHRRGLGVLLVYRTPRYLGDDPAAGPAPKGDGKTEPGREK